MAKERGVEFFYLPPKSPKLNPNVERVNRTWREDFYDLWTFDKGIIYNRPQYPRVGVSEFSDIDLLRYFVDLIQ